MAKAFVIALSLAACSSDAGSDDPGGRADTYVDTTVLVDSVDLSWLYDLVSTDGMLKDAIKPLDDRMAQTVARWDESLPADKGFVGYPIDNAASYQMVDISVKMALNDHTIPVICLISKAEGHLGSCVEGTPDDDNGDALAGVVLTEMRHPEWRSLADLVVVTTPENFAAKTHTESDRHGFGIDVTYLRY